MIPLVIDAAVIVLFVVCIFVGWNRGLLSTALSLVGTAASFAGALYGSDYLSNWLYESYLKEKLVSSVEAAISGTTDVGAIADALKKGVTGLFVGGKAEELAKLFPSLASSGVGSVAETVVETAAAPAVLTITRAVIFILLFILIQLIFGLLAKLAAKLNRVPVLGPVNKLLGSLAGVVWGLVIFLIISTGVKFALGFTDWGGTVTPIIDRTRLFSVIYNLDVLSYIKSF